MRRALQLSPRRAAPAERIRFPDALPDLKQPPPAGEAAALERGRDGQTDGLVRPALVRHDEVGVQRIEAALPALHGGEEGFQVDRDIGSLFHARPLLPAPAPRTSKRPGSAPFRRSPGRYPLIFLLAPRAHPRTSEWVLYAEDEA